MLFDLLWFGMSRFRTPVSRSACGAVGLALASLLPMAGCMKVHLAKIPVSSMVANLAEAQLAHGPGIAPGEKLSLVVTLTKPDGKVLTTAGKGGGRVLWSDLQVTATVVLVSREGMISLPDDPRISEGKVPHVIITVPSHPDLRAELDIPVRYDHNYTSSFSGRSGKKGVDGTGGLDGHSGKSGSMDIHHRSPGENGSNGGDGGSGQRGGDGEDGPPVAVRVALHAGSHPLLQVGVSARGRESLYLVDPQGGSLTVRSLGGPGGPGGKGGRGGRGGSGGTGSPSGRRGSNGLDGRRGLSGSSGHGGSITVTYDPLAKPFLNVIQLSSPGGPSPLFREEPVPPLW